MPLLIVRHAHAGRRGTFPGDDRDRPLSERGLRQAAGLVPLLGRYRPQRILSSPYLRCHSTVRPIADTRGISIETVEELAEGHQAAALSLMERMAGESAILCTHGDVAAGLGDVLAGALGPEDRKDLRLQKGEVWVIKSTAHGSASPLEIVDHIRPTDGIER